MKEYLKDHLRIDSRVIDDPATGPELWITLRLDGEAISSALVTQDNLDTLIKG